MTLRANMYLLSADRKRTLRIVEMGQLPVFFVASSVSKHQTISDHYRALNKENWEAAASQTVGRCCAALCEGRSGGAVANGLMPGHQDNLLLAALPSETLDLMGRDLRQISLAQGRAIYEPGAPIDEVYCRLN
jgi:hypothetical protein